jgi:erythromycin esterase
MWPSRSTPQTINTAVNMTGTNRLRRTVLPTLLVPALLSSIAAFNGSPAGSGEDPIPTLRQSAVSLADNGLEGAAGRTALLDMVGSATVVGLGEATHGTREFFVLKRQAIQALATRGFRGVGFEAPWAGTRTIAAYVEGQSVSEQQVLAALQYNVWRTQEVMDLLRWMRAENARRAPAERLIYFGYDPQDYEYRASGGTMKQIIDLTTSVDASLGATIRQQYTDFTLATDTIGASMRYSPAQRTRLRGILADIRQRMTGAEPSLAGRLGTADASWLLRSVAVVEQNWTKAEFDLAGERDKAFSYRDSTMAANARWWQQRLGSNGRVALWAHNGHVGRFSVSGFNAMGLYLSREIGAQYWVLGFAFGSGQFNGNAPSDPQRIPAAAAGTVDATLARAADQTTLFNLRTLSGAAAQWSRSAKGLRWFGAGELPTGPVELWDVPLQPTFDALIYVPLTTPSIKMP